MKPLLWIICSLFYLTPTLTLAVEFEDRLDRAKTLYRQKAYDKARQELEAALDLLSASGRPPSTKEQFTDAGHGFNYKSIRLKQGAFGGVDVIGEMMNRSKDSYQLVIFVMSAYDSAGNLLGTTAVSIGSFESGQTKSFDAAFLDLQPEEIKSHKI